MKFNDLLFRSQKYTQGMQAVVIFPNGYGASVVHHSFSYGNAEGLYELAVIKGKNETEWELCYDTEITDDVLGYLKPSDIDELLVKIEEI